MLAPVTTPRYVALAALVRDRIAGEQLAPHTLLPSERELGDAHGVSRMTARQALTLLEREGLVYRRPPRGTFVAEPRVRFHVGSFSEEASRQGRRPAARLLWAERQEPSPDTRRALGLAEGEEVHAFHRVRSMDGVPLALETTYFPADLTPGILDVGVEGSLWAVLRERYGVDPATSTAVLESIILDDVSQAHLGAGSATTGILLTRSTYDAAGRCIEHARDVYRADRASFEVTATVAPPD